MINEKEQEIPATQPPVETVLDNDYRFVRNIWDDTIRKEVIENIHKYVEQVQHDYKGKI